MRVQIENLYKKQLLGNSGSRNYKLRTNYGLETMGMIRYLRFKVFEGTDEQVKELSMIGRDEVSDDEEDFWGPCDSYDGEVLDPISLANEICVHELIISQVSQKLNFYSTTIEEDRALFDSNLTENQRNILKIRIGEKDIF
jgi:hypothetical protein